MNKVSLAGVEDQLQCYFQAFRQFTDLEDALCGAHMLHLVVRNGLFPMKDSKFVDTPVNNVFVRGRSLISHFRHSPLAVGHLAEMQKEHQVPEHALIQAIETITFVIPKDFRTWSPVGTAHER